MSETTSPATFGPAARAGRIWAENLVLGAGAVLMVAMATVHTDADLPSWNAVEVAAMLVVPLTIRFGVVIESSAGAIRLSTASALLFAKDLDTPLDLLAPWSVLVMVAHVWWFGPRRGIGRGAVEVIAGTTMVVVAGHVDAGLWPLDRAVIATAVYIACVLVLEARGAAGRPLTGAVRGVRRADALLVIAGHLAACLATAIARAAYEESPGPAADAASGALLLVYVAAQILVSRYQAYMRGADALARAGTTMPWPATRIDERLVRLTQRAVRAHDVCLQAEPGSGTALSVPVAGRGHLVAVRRRGDLRFTAAEARTMTALVRMAETSRERAVHEARLRRQATTDALTGLITFSIFRSRLEDLRVLQHGEALAVVFADLDGFKMLNTELGHLVADQILAAIGERLRSQLPNDTIACRFGGDEFVIAIPRSALARDQSPEDLVASAIAEPMLADGEAVRVVASLGVAWLLAPDDDIDAVIGQAEVAMRQRKRERLAGPTVRTQRSMLEALLDRQELTVAYQPIFDLRTGDLHGVEALLRARDGALGTLSPLLVVDSAVRSHRVDELTALVAARAVAVAEQLADQVGPTTLSLNLEFEQLHEESGLLAGLRDRAGQRDVHLVLELSERAFIDWGPSHDATASALAAAGIGLAIDDFGAGFATYALLEKWTWEWVKVDRRLVSAPGNGDARLVTHVLELITDLGHVAVAEGIETSEQLATVRRLGARYGQGHHLAPPLTGGELLERFANSGSPAPALADDPHRARRASAREPDSPPSVEG